jgi:hypothetical protein
MWDGLFYLFVFIIIAALATLALWIAQRSYGFNPNRLLPSKPQKRLALIETKFLDRKHKLVLVRRDNVEHLVMIGGPVDMLIETGIPMQNPAAIRMQGPHWRDDNEQDSESDSNSTPSQNGTAPSSPIAAHMETNSAG